MTTDTNQPYKTAPDPSTGSIKAETPPSEIAYGTDFHTCGSMTCDISLLQC